MSLTLLNVMFQDTPKQGNVLLNTEKRTGAEGSFRFLAWPKAKAIANESPKAKAKRERKKVEALWGDHEGRWSRG